MTALPIKLSGLTTPACVALAAQYATYAAFVFYPHPTRRVAATQVGEMTRGLSHELGLVGMFTNPADDELEEVLSACPLDIIHLHGNESPERITAIKRNFTLPLIKTIRLGSAADTAQFDTYKGVVDMLQVTGMPAPGTTPLHRWQDAPLDPAWLVNKKPGGTWFWGGGIDTENMAGLVKTTGAPLLDFMGELDEKPGVLSAEKLQKACTLARGLYAIKGT